MLTPSKIKDLQAWSVPASFYSLPLICLKGIKCCTSWYAWKGLEPSKGQYNETYLANFKQLVADLAKAGIYNR